MPLHGCPYRLITLQPAVRTNPGHSMPHRGARLPGLAPSPLRKAARRIRSQRSGGPRSPFRSDRKDNPDEDDPTAVVAATAQQLTPAGPGQPLQQNVRQLIHQRDRPLGPGWITNCLDKRLLNRAAPPAVNRLARLAGTSHTGTGPPRRGPGTNTGWGSCRQQPLSLEPHDRSGHMSPGEPGPVLNLPDRATWILNRVFEHGCFPSAQPEVPGRACCQSG